MIDVTEGRRLKAAAEEAWEEPGVCRGEHISVKEALMACDAWERWLDTNIAALLDAAERTEAAGRERDDLLSSIEKLKAGHLSIIEALTKARDLALDSEEFAITLSGLRDRAEAAERELAEARKDAERFAWWFESPDKADLDQWRDAIDAERAAIDAERGKG